MVDYHKKILIIDIIDINNLPFMSHLRSLRKEQTITQLSWNNVRKLNNAKHIFYQSDRIKTTASSVSLGNIERYKLK